MLTEQRQEEILKLVNEHNSMTVQELKDIFHASESTIRRDITALDRRGKLEKVFGGAIALEETLFTRELSVSQKELINQEEKMQIARYAAALIEPGDYVYIDSGTTTAAMIDYIRETDAVYVTNAVAHAKRLVTLGCKVMLIGGELKETTEAVIGAEAVLHIQRFHFSKGFFGSNGVSLNAGFTTPDVREAMVKQVAIEGTQPGKRYLLTDHSKFGQVASVTFSMFDGTVVLTDKRPEEAYMKSLSVKVCPE